MRCIQIRCPPHRRPALPNSWSVQIFRHTRCGPPSYASPPLSLNEPHSNFRKLIGSLQDWLLSQPTSLGRPKDHAGLCPRRGRLPAGDSTGAPPGATGGGFALRRPARPGGIECAPRVLAVGARLYQPPTSRASRRVVGTVTRVLDGRSHELRSATPSPPWAHYPG